MLCISSIYGSVYVFYHQPESAPECDFTPVVHMELWSYQRGYLSTACHAEEAGRGDGRYDTLPGPKPRQPAPVTHEKKTQLWCMAVQAVCLYFWVFVRAGLWLYPSLRVSCKVSNCLCRPVCMHPMWMHTYMMCVSDLECLEWYMRPSGCPRMYVPAFCVSYLRIA